MGSIILYVKNSSMFLIMLENMFLVTVAFVAGIWYFLSYIEAWLCG